MRPLGVGLYLGSPSAVPADSCTAVHEAAPRQCDHLSDTQGKGIPMGPCLYSGEKLSCLNQIFCLPMVLGAAVEPCKKHSCRAATRKHQKRF